MKKNLFILLIISSSLHLNAQSYESSWESLDSRPVPTWFEDAKSGIFIHWGGGLKIAVPTMGLDEIPS